MKRAPLYLIALSLSSGQAFANEPTQSSTKLEQEQLKCVSPQITKRTSQKSSSVKPGTIEQQVTVYCAQPAATQNQSIEKIPKSGKDPLPIDKIIDAIAKLFASLAWPIAAIVIAHQFRKELAALLSRVKRGKLGSAELEFADYVNEVEEVSDIPRTPEGERISASTMAYASNNPRAAILTSWLEVESALNSLVKLRQLSTISTRTSKGILPAIRAVQKAELLDSNYVALFHDLRVMRNEAAHAIDFDPPADSVIKYAQLANELTNAIRKAADMG